MVIVALHCTFIIHISKRKIMIDTIIFTRYAHIVVLIKACSKRRIVPIE